jgi:hypothetical protein
MAYQKVRALEADVTYALGKLNKKTGKTDPKMVEGYYLGTRLVETPLGDSTLHYFETQSGVVAVWGATKLNSGLSQVKLGNMTRVEFVGVGKPSKGKQGARLFDIQQDPDNSIEVLPAGETLASSNVEDIQQDEGDEPETRYSETSEDDEDNSAVIAAQAVADRKAAVLAQLKAKGLKK